MLKQTTLAALTLGLTMYATAPVGAQDGAKQAPGNVEAVALRIVKPIEGQDGDDGLRPFYQFPGTTVVLLVSGGNKTLVSIDQNKGELKTFVDDKGTDLLDSDNQSEFGRQGFGMMVDTTEDGSLAMIEANAFGLPVKGATKLKLTGTILAKVATKQEEHKAMAVAFVNGSKVTAGPLKGEIEKAGKPEWGDSEMEVKLTFKQDLSGVSEIIFLDPSGEPIDARRSSTSRMSFGNNVTTSMTYEFEQKVPAATILFKVWSDIEEVQVPFEVEISMGL